MDMIHRYAGLAIASCDHSSSPKNQISQLPWSQPVQPPRPPYQQSRSHCHREPGAPNHASHINESCTHELSSILLERDKQEWIIDELFRHVDNRQSQRRFDQHTSNFLHTSKNHTLIKDVLVFWSDLHLKHKASRCMSNAWGEQALHSDNRLNTFWP